MILHLHSPVGLLGTAVVKWAVRVQEGVVHLNCTQTPQRCNVTGLLITQTAAEHVSNLSGEYICAKFVVEGSFLGGWGFCRKEVKLASGYNLMRQRELAFKTCVKWNMGKEKMV